ncbi:bZIP transcription factor 29-like isoform X1 [Coffea arabica]|uniref:BZIP transcription factor 29-like isoform X1 n=2 Tax=Coffea arabica TaxID=13443 RepID=A0ABM4W1W1_COFAR
MAQLNCKQPMNQNYGAGSSHSRSTSQPAFFANHSLPPLSPLPHSESSLASNSSIKDVSMDEVDVSSRVPPVVGGPSVTFENNFRGNFEGLPPRKGHRRSSSDVPLGFNVMIQTSPQLVPISGQGISGKTAFGSDKVGMDKAIHLQKQEMDAISEGNSNFNSMGQRRLEGEIVNDLFQSYLKLDNADSLNPSRTDEKDKRSMVSGMKKCGGENSNTEAQSISKANSTKFDGTGSAEGNKRSATGDIAPAARHFRSLSVDSAFGSLHFNEVSPKLPSAAGIHVSELSPSNLASENSAKFSLDFGNGEFSEAEVKKIMTDERLAEIALSDPKRAKRVLANRQSAARSKERKLRYISELEHKVLTLQTEATTLSAQLTVLQKDFSELTNQNNELKFRLQAMEQQARLRDALHEALTAEVQRLKLAAAELGEDDGSSTSMIQQLPMKHHVLQLQHHQSSQIQQLSVATSKTATTTSATPTSA